MSHEFLVAQSLSRICTSNEILDERHHCIIDRAVSLGINCAALL
jgi:hypothetical protein